MTEFMGIPISGDVHAGRGYTDQRSKEEFAALVKPLLDDDGIKALNWAQYTPYFNDGDVCEFSAGDLRVRTAWDDEGEYIGELEVGEYHPTLGNLNHVRNTEPSSYGRGNYTYYGWHDEPRDNPNYSAERLAACLALSRAITSGSFDQVLNELFGDHAEVTITREGITIDYYEHD